MNPSLFTLQQLWKKGHREVKKLVKLTGLNKRTIQRNLKMFGEGLTLEKRKKPGKPALLKTGDRRRLTALAKKNDTASCRDLQLELIKRGSPEVAPRTILDYLHKAGLRSLQPKFQPLLTEAHKLKRVVWCQSHLRTKWGRWVFTDESRFQLYTNKRGRWAKERPQIGRPKYNPGIMVWGGFSSKGKTDLVVIRGKVDSKKYQEIMESVQATIKDLHPAGFILQQDGATPHTSKSTKEWLSANKWNVSDWPANSPDLNPIENIWGMMKKAIEKKKPKDLEELVIIIQEIWITLTPEYLLNLVNSMQMRINKCIELKGNSTGY